ncbi:MAG: ABC transporter substrate-binding protein [Promethearchaeota archaeon]
MVGEKVTLKKKPTRINELKKPIIAGGLVAVVAIAGIIIGINLIGEQNGEDKPEEPDILTIGVYIGPQSFDPFRLPWPVAPESAMLLFQVVEGLFEHDKRNKTNPIVNNLAIKGEWSNDALNFTCTLRKGVKFHDGTPFNATVVKWNIDRLYNFINTQPSNVSWWIPIMWHLPDGITPIINETKVLDDYTVRFLLNEPFVPLKSLLMHYSAFMLSPTSTPFDRLIDIRNEKIIGTGAFTLDSFNITLDFGWLVVPNTTLKANQEYWHGQPEIDEIFFKPFEFDTERWEEMRVGNLSFTYAEEFFGDTNLTVLETMRNTPEVNVLTLNTDTHHYIFMHYERINTTMRKAISYAFNYTHDYEIMGPHEYGDRVRSYIPSNFLYANWTAFNVPDYNITKARQVLKDANWLGTENLTVNGDISPGNDWELKANSSTPLATYKTGNGYDRIVLPKTAVLLNETLKQIGVKLEIYNMSGDEYYDNASLGNLDFIRVKYLPDYDDPDNIITPFFANITTFENYKIYRYNDSWIQQKIKEGITEIDPVVRKQIYYEIQKYLIEESFPHLMLYNSKNYAYWNSNVGNVLSAYRTDHSFFFKDLYIIKDS